MSADASRPPEWEEVLLAAARLQGLLPGAVLVGGTAAALHAGHRFSRDADHVLLDLADRYDEVLEDLESVAGWKTARVQRPVQILGNLDGIETGIRQLIRKEPLESLETRIGNKTLRIPTPREILRIKALLILKRNATRDYLDFVAMASHLGDEETRSGMGCFDALYPQPNGASPSQQLQIQLASPMPYDLDSENLSEYRNLREDLREWSHVRESCVRLAFALFDKQDCSG